MDDWQNIDQEAWQVKTTTAALCLYAERKCQCSSNRFKHCRRKSL